MTNLEALRMVRKASLYAQPMNSKPRAYAKAGQEIAATFLFLQRALEFEIGTEGQEEKALHAFDRIKMAVAL